jgi:hypothetical protein
VPGDPIASVIPEAGRELRTADAAGRSPPAVINSRDQAAVIG